MSLTTRVIKSESFPVRKGKGARFAVKGETVEVDAKDLARGELLDAFEPLESDPPAPTEAPEPPSHPTPPEAPPAPPAEDDDDAASEGTTPNEDDNDDEPEATEPAEPKGLHALSNAELVELLRKTKPNIDKTLAMAEGNPLLAKRLLTCESTASNGHPRPTLVPQLQAIIDEA